MKKSYLILIILLIIAFGFLAWMYLGKNAPTNEEQPIAQADYLCNDGKTINAKYYQEPKLEQPKPGEPPTPTGKVALLLSDERKLTLAQTISASGVRYATENESFVFWNKGNSVFITENDIQTYAGCIVIAKDPGGLAQVYKTAGFSIRYPAGYSVDSNYQYQELGPGKEIKGIKFIIPSEIATGTNLSSFDTGISIESMPAVENCNAGLFIDLQESQKISEITDNDIQYSVASSTGAAAGNRYDEIVWAFPRTTSCFATRYFIHSTNIGNYPEGTKTEFNREQLVSQFDAIRRSLKLDN